MVCLVTGNFRSHDFGFHGHRFWERENNQHNETRLMDYSDPRSEEETVHPYYSSGILVTLLIYSGIQPFETSSVNENDNKSKDGF